MILIKWVTTDFNSFLKYSILKQNRFPSESQTQNYILSLIPGRNLFLRSIFYHQSILSCFCKITCLFFLRSHSNLLLKEKQTTKKNNISNTVLLWVMQNMRKKSRLKMRNELFQNSLTLTNPQSLSTNLFNLAKENWTSCCFRRNSWQNSCKPFFQYETTFEYGRLMRTKIIYQFFLHHLLFDFWKQILILLCLKYNLLIIVTNAW